MELLESAWTDINDTLVFDYWFIAIFLNIFGNLIASARWCLQELHNAINCGFAMYYIGDTICKLSYGFGPIALLLPLHSLIIVFDTLFKSNTFRVNKKQIIGIITVLIGISLMIIFGPRSYYSYYTIDDLLYKFNESSSLFIISIMSIFVFLNWLIFKCECRILTNEFKMLTYIHIASYFGSWNIVLTKCILELIVSSLMSAEYAHINWTHWVTYILIIAFILSFIGVENWKYKAIKIYNTQYILTIYTFLLIIIGIILGSMLFDEFTNMSFGSVITYFIAIFISFIGVGMVTFLNTNLVSLKNNDFNEMRMDTFTMSEGNGGTISMHVSDTQMQRNLKQSNENTQNSINWQIIGQILMDHNFMSNVEEINVTLDSLEDFFEEEGIHCDEFRDALCGSYCSLSDEGTILWQCLFHTLGFNTEKRMRFYNLLLHEYFPLSDMTTQNFIQILSKMTRELNVPMSEFVKIKEIILNKKLNGYKFENHCNTEFEKLFRLIRNVNSQIWALIYEELMYWAFQEFEEENGIDWEYVGSVLWANNFCNNQDTLNSCLDQLEANFESNNIGTEAFKEELCNCYGNKNEKESVLRKVLFEICNYNKQTRLRFYDILLHKYIDLESLNTSQVITVLRRSASHIDNKNNLDWTKFISILKLKRINGSVLANMPNCEAFVNIFESMKNTHGLLEKIYDFEIAKWQPTPTELSLQKSPSVTPPTKTIKMFEIKDILSEKSKSIKNSLKNRLSSPKHSLKKLKKPKRNKNKNKYCIIENDFSVENSTFDESNEIAEALIDILEDVVLSQKDSYIPSKRARSMSRSRSKRKHHRKTKRRRPSNAQKIFPRHRTHKKTKVTKRSKSNDSISNILFDSDFKFVFEAGKHFKQRQLLSFIIDAFDLIRLHKNNTFNIRQFIRAYSEFKSVENYIINTHKLNRDFLCKLFDEYYLLFGHELSLNPSIKIKDSLMAFMSYTFSVSAAIQKYINNGENNILKSIDLWIIPNKTVSSNTNMEFINEIGDISEMLREHKIRFISKECHSNNIRQTESDISQCLREIQTNVNRVIFIIDRRYKLRDNLYCFIPPKKYAKIEGNFKNQSINDSFHIKHTYNTSRFLLPNIGASDNCNGYMFALSFVIYETQTKIYFYSQGGKMRFLPNQIGLLWPKYFVKNESNNYYSTSDIHTFVKKLFALNVSDAYFERHKDLQRCVWSEIQKDFQFGTECTNERGLSEEYISFSEKCVFFEKTFCQTQINNENVIIGRIPSTTSSNITPTMTTISQMTPLSHHQFGSQNNNEFNNKHGKIAMQQRQTNTEFDL